MFDVIEVGKFLACLGLAFIVVGLWMEIQDSIDAAS